MEISAYNIYEIDISKDTKLKVDCSFEDIAFIVVEKNKETIDSFEISYDYLSSLANAISYVLKSNKDFKIIRNIANETYFRYQACFLKDTLFLKYIEDGNEECNAEFNLKISFDVKDKLKDFFDTIYELERR